MVILIVKSVFQHYGLNRLIGATMMYVNECRDRSTMEAYVLDVTRNPLPVNQGIPDFRLRFPLLLTKLSLETNRGLRNIMPEA